MDGEIEQSQVSEEEREDDRYSAVVVFQNKFGQTGGESE
jgi:hypothetical protein